VWGRIISLVCLTGCDYLFQLEHIDRSDAAKPVCPPAGGVTTTKQFGARSGGTAPTPTADTFLSQDTAHANSNYGGVDKIFVCTQCSCTIDCESIAGGDDDVRGLVRFDLAADIPVCSNVRDAFLLFDTTGDNLGSGFVVLYAVREAWNEGTGSATGSSEPANWNNRVPGVPWVDDGVGPGSRSAAELGRFAPTGANTNYKVDIDELAVQGWVDDPPTNNGAVMVVTSSTSDVHFHSREAIDPARRPALVVTYDPP
jgi:hypothetical protein